MTETDKTTKAMILVIPILMGVLLISIAISPIWANDGVADGGNFPTTVIYAKNGPVQTSYIFQVGTDIGWVPCTVTSFITYEGIYITEEWLWYHNPLGKCGEIEVRYTLPTTLSEPDNVAFNTTMSGLAETPHIPVVENQTGVYLGFHSLETGHRFALRTSVHPNAHDKLIVEWINLGVMQLTGT